MPGTFSAAAPASNPRHQAAPRPSRGPSMSGPGNRYRCQKLRQAVTRAVRSSSPASRLSSNDGELKRSAHHRCCLRRCLCPVLAGARAGHDAPHPGPLPHQTYPALVGGPLDGLLLDNTGWCPQVIDDGTALVTELGRWPGGRSLYDPCPASRARRAARVWCGSSGAHPDSSSWPEGRGGTSGGSPHVPEPRSVRIALIVKNMPLKG